MVVIEPINPNLRINVAAFRKAFEKILSHEVQKGIELFERSAKYFEEPKPGRPPKKKRKRSKNRAGRRKLGGKPAFTSTKVKEVGFDLERTYGALKNFRGGANYIYSILNWGDKQRFVLHPDDPPMVFRSGYVSSTSPARPLDPIPPREGEGTWVSLRQFEINIQARRFDKAVAKRRKQYMKKVAQNRIRDAAKRMWMH